MRRRSDVRKGFCDRASFLILLLLAKPLGGFGRSRKLIAAVPLPGVAGVSVILWRTLGITDHRMNWRNFTGATDANLLGLGILFACLFWREVAAQQIAAATGVSGIWR